MKKQRGDILLSIVAFIQPLLLIIQLILGDSGLVSAEGAAKFRIIFSAVPVLFSFPLLLKRNLFLVLKLYICVCVLFLFSFFMNNGNLEYIIDEGVKFICFINIPILLSIVSIQNYKWFFLVLKWVSYLIAFLGFIYFYLYIIGYLNLESVYNMSFGYSILLPTIYFLWKKNNFSIVISLLLLLIMLITGSRGPTVAAVSYIVLSFFLHSNKKEKSLFVLILFVLSISLPILYTILQTYDMNSRSLNLLLDGAYISYDSGRGQIYSTIWRQICTSSFFGNGLFFDRLLLNGSYTHNLFLELFLNFGLFIGLWIVFLFGSFFFYTYKKTTKENQIFLLFITCFTIVQLLVSSSYLISYNIYILLGITYSIYKNRLILYER